MRASAVAFALMLSACASAPPAQTTIAPPAPSATAKAETPACPSHLALATPVEGSLPPPSSWVHREAPAPASETIECANLSQREWKIEEKNGQIVPRLTVGTDRGDKIPFSFHATKKDEAALHGTAHVHRAADGYWVGFDAGEYGGALYSFSSDGKTRHPLSTENVIGFGDLRNGTVVVTGLAHLGMSVGHLAIVSGSVDASHVEPWIDLGGAAETFFVESPESMLVLTTGGLFRITACGDVNRIARTNYDALYPSSMLADSRGVIWIGMRQFVVRWIPGENGTYREEWLTSSDCTEMKREKFECRCRAG